MNKWQGTISEQRLAEYTALLQYTSAWRKLDLGLLKKILAPDVIFDAPGTPFSIEGIEKSIKAHALLFENLQDNDIRISGNQSSRLSSSYNVIPQIYPYENRGVYPFMQLSYFTEHNFLKLVYFFVDLDYKLERISAIKTHSTKFLVNTQNDNQSVRRIQELNYTLNTQYHE